jgi:hypothetical protein
MYSSTIFLFSIFLIYSNGYASFNQEKENSNLILGQKNPNKENYKRPQRQRTIQCCKFCENNEKEEIEKQTRAKKRQKRPKRAINIPVVEANSNAAIFPINPPPLIHNNPVEIKSSEEVDAAPLNVQPPMMVKAQRPKPVPRVFTFSAEDIELSSLGKLGY